MEDGKSSINLLTWILIAIVIYMIWAYFDCTQKTSGWVGGNRPKCSPLAGFDPFINLFNKPNNTNAKEGDVCKVSISDLSPNGTIKNGVCIGNDGVPCFAPNQVSLQPQGTWNNGICVPPTPKQTIPSTVKIKVTNPNGTRILTYQNGNFVSGINASLIPLNTVLDVTQQVVISAKTYYNTIQGWIDGNDVTITQ